MPQILVVNPSSRKGVRKMAKKRRSAAQRAATARMIAANRARRSKAPRRARRRNASVAPLVRVVNARRRAAAPKRRRARTSAVAATAAGRTLRYRRRNPTGGFVRDAMAVIVPSAVGGAGALGLDVLLGVLPLPEAMKMGPMRPVVRVAGAIGLGMLVSMVASKQTATQVASGAMTVVLYDTIKGFLARTGMKIPGIAMYEIPGIGMYEVEPAPQLGYTDSGQQVGVEMYPDAVAEYDDSEGVYR